MPIALLNPDNFLVVIALIVGGLLFWGRRYVWRICKWLGNRIRLACPRIWPFVRRFGPIVLGVGILGLAGYFLRNELLVILNSIIANRTIGVLGATTVVIIITSLLLLRRQPQPAQNRCPKCSNAVRLDQKICPNLNCGEKLILPPYCIGCSSRIDYTDNWCGDCGMRIVISRFISYFSATAGIVYSISALILFFFWNPFVDIGLAIFIMFAINIYRKNRRGISIRNIIGWRMWYAYASIIALILSLLTK